MFQSHIQASRCPTHHWFHFICSKVTARILSKVQKGEMHPDVAAEILGTSVAALKVDGGAGDVRGQKRPLSSEPEKPDTPKADAINDELDAIFDEAIKQRRDSQLKFVFFSKFRVASYDLEAGWSITIWV